MAKKKAEAAEPASGEAAAPAEKINKAEAVRRALADGVESPTEGIEYVRKKFGLEMTTQQFSTNKFQARKKAGVTPAKRGRKPSTNGSPAPVAPPQNGLPNMVFHLEALKALCDQLGVDQVTALAQLFRK